MNRGPWVTFFLALLLFLPSLGLKDFYTRGEPREALVVQSIVTTGNWILPRGYGDVVPSKPLMSHWLAAGFSKLLGGVSEFTVRLPAALASAFFLLFFYIFIEKRADRRHAYLSCLILLTSVEWFRGSDTARVDMVFSTLLCAGLLTSYSWLKDHDNKFPWASILLLSGATLAKGPVSIVLPGLITGSFLLIERRPLKEIIFRCLKLFAPVVIISLLWYAAAYTEGGDEFLGRVSYENFQRFAGTMADEPHKHSAFYLLGTIILGFLPWSILALVAFGSDLYSRRVTLPGVLAGVKKLRGFELFSVLAATEFVLFFCIPTSKRSVYLLPIYPLLAFFLARQSLMVLDRAPAFLFKVHGLIMALLLSVLGLALSGTIVGAAGLMKHPEEVSYYLELLAGVLRNGSIVTYGFLLLTLVCAVAYFYFLLKKQFMFPLVVAFYLFFFATLDYAVLPPLANSISSKSFAAEVASLSQGPLYSFGNEFYGLSFYLKKTIFRLPEDGGEGERIVFCYESSIADLKSKIGPEASIQILARSDAAVDKPLSHLVMVKVS